MSISVAFAKNTFSLAKKYKIFVEKHPFGVSQNAEFSCYVWEDALALRGYTLGYMFAKQGTFDAELALKRAKRRI